MSIPLKFPRCLVHGQKMCILFAYNPNIILFQVETFFRRPYIESQYIVGILCAQLLPQFNANCFETLQMSWSENVHIFWILSSNYFCFLFHKLLFVAFKAFITIKVTISDAGYLYADSLEF